MLFRDRHDAGRMLAEAVAERSPALGPNPIVLALPRGGVPVGYEVARRIGAPLDVFLVRKLGVPGHEELAMGAIASGGVVVLSRDIIDAVGVTDDEIERVVAAEQRELLRREQAYRQGPPPQLAGRGVILVDDGLATGASMRAAVAAVGHRGPARITVAVPVAAPSTVRELAAVVDEIVCVATPEPFWGVGGWYDDFSQVSDEEVRRLLAAARGEARPSAP